MPKFTDGMTAVTTANNYHFTATNIQDLGASEYTLVSIICDVSSSIYYYEKALADCIKTVVDSCRKSPRSDNLMIRLCTFNHQLKEVHGFKELRNIGASDYQSVIKSSGSTALYEAIFECIDAADRYGKTLADNHFSVNAIVFVITDGEDNSSGKKPRHIKKLIKAIRKKEDMASLVSVLIGVTGDQGISSYLASLQKDAGLEQYIDLGDATSDSLAGLAGFMSRSICMTSQVLSSGGMAPAIPLKI